MTEKNPRRASILICERPGDKIPGAVIPVALSPDGHGDCEQLNEAGKCGIGTTDKPNCIYNLTRRIEIETPSIEDLRDIYARLSKSPAITDAEIQRTMIPMIGRFLDAVEPRISIGEIARVTGIIKHRIRYAGDQLYPDLDLPSISRMYKKDQAIEIIYSIIRSDAEPRRRGRPPRTLPKTQS